MPDTGTNENTLTGRNVAEAVERKVSTVWWIYG